MVEYIKQIARDLFNEPLRAVPLLIAQALSEEVERLDPRDFLPAVQANLVRVRISLKDLLKRPNPNGIEFLVVARNIAQQVDGVMGLYGGVGNRVVSRNFGFVTNQELRTIIERDYRELALILLPGGAWKSTVVIAGSVLEAILFDLLTADATVQGKALASAKAPKKLDLRKDEWKLHHLIEVAVELSLLPSARAEAIDTVLRDYRILFTP
jgi:hypothetical protein